MLLNLGLMAWLSLVLSRKPEVNAGAATPKVNDQERQSATVGEPQWPEGRGADTKPLQWNQIESADYRRVGAGRRKPEIAEPSMPLAFQAVDASALNLNARQVQAISDLQQWFTDQVGGPEQDPTDPNYRERWLKAQPEMNDRMRGMIGVNAFEDYQLAARAWQQRLGPIQK